MDILDKFSPQPKSSVLAVDIGYQNIKYLWLKKSRKQWIVENFGKISYQEDTEVPAEGLSKSISRLPFDPKKLKSSTVVIGLTPERYKVCKRSYPKLPAKELNQMVLFDLQREVMGEGESGEILYYLKSAGADLNQVDQIGYVLVGAAEEDITEKTTAFISHNIIPNMINIQFATFASLCHGLPSHTGPVGFLDIGAQKSMLAIVQDGHIEYHREVMVGGNDFTKAITGTIFHEGRAIQLMTAEANEFKFKYGYPIGFSEGMTFQGAPLTEVGAMMRPVVERLAGEIHRSIGFFEEKGRVEKIQAVYLLGGGSLLKNLPEVLTEKVNIDIKRLPFPSNIRLGSHDKRSHIFQRKFAELAVAYSLVLSIDAKANLLPSIFKKIHMTAVIHRIVQYFILILIGGITLFSFNMITKKNALATELIRLRVDVDEATTKEQLYTSLKNKKEGKASELQGIDNQIKTDPRPFKILKMLSNITPDEFILTKVEYLSKAEDSSDKKKKSEKKENENTWQLVLSGETKNPAEDIRIAVAQFVLELERSGYFTSIELTKDILADDRSSFMFDLVAEVKE